jgi:thiamine pyrophosphokinase
VEKVAVSDTKKPSERPIYEGDSAVTLLGGGSVRTADLDDALRHAPVLIAADGGADAALAAGRMPVAVVGDLDSLSSHARTRLSPEILYETLEQDTTDFDKALRRVAAPLVLAVGFTGARLDHELAVFHTLVARPAHRCIVVGDRDIVFLAPPRVRLDLEPGTRVSLFPMDEVSGGSEGLRWPIDGLVFHPARRIGTSNEVASGPVLLHTDRPALLVILPRETLEPAIRALGAADTLKWAV